MGVATTTYHVTTSNGLREDLLDMVVQLDPYNNWCLDNFGSSTAKQTYHEWLTLAMDTAAANSGIEGATVTPTASTGPTRTGNYVQDPIKTWSFSDDMVASTYAGMKDIKSFYMTRAATALSHDIEYALVINATSSAGDSATGRLSKGLIGWIATNTSSASATGVALSSALFNAQLQTVWEAAGGMSFDILVGGYNKRIISAFTGNTRNISAEAKKQNAVLDVYESDFGVCRIKAHMTLSKSSGGSVLMLGDASTYWKIAWLRKPKNQDLGRTSTGTQGYVDCAFTLEALQQLTAGYIKSTKSS